MERVVIFQNDSRDEVQTKEVIIKCRRLSTARVSECAHVSECAS